MSVHHMYGWYLRRSEEDIYNLSELELWVVVSCHVDARNQA